MLNYLAFICGGVSARSQSPEADGVEMAARCLRRLEETGNPEQFPPRLLILLTSPAYNDAGSIKQMISGIRRAVSDYQSRTFDEAKAESTDVPLIGSSVEAVFFDRQIHEQGALLVCLASRLIHAKICVSGDVQNDHKGAVDNLLRQLESSILDTDSPRGMQLTDCLLLSFLPNVGRHDENTSYLPPDLHSL